MSKRMSEGERIFYRAENAWATVESILAIPALLLASIVGLGSSINPADPHWGREHVFWSLALAALAAISFSQRLRLIGYILMAVALGVLFRGANYTNPDTTERDEMASWKQDEAKWILIDREKSARDAHYHNSGEMVNDHVEFLNSRGRCMEYKLDAIRRESGYYPDWCPNGTALFDTFKGQCYRMPDNKMLYCCEGGWPRKYVDPKLVGYRGRSESTSPSDQYFDDGSLYDCEGRRRKVKKQ